jgi:hypothetical protein
MFWFRMVIQSMAVVIASSVSSKLWHRKMRFSIKKRQVGSLYIGGNGGYTLNKENMKICA